MTNKELSCIYINLTQTSFKMSISSHLLSGIPPKQMWQQHQLSQQKLTGQSHSTCVEALVLLFPEKVGDSLYFSPLNRQREVFCSLGLQMHFHILTLLLKRMKMTCNSLRHFCNFSHQQPTFPCTELPFLYSVEKHLNSLNTLTHLKDHLIMLPVLTFHKKPR